MWQIRMRVLSGAIAVSALFQVVVGYCGNLLRQFHLVRHRTRMKNVSF